MAQAFVQGYSKSIGFRMDIVGLDEIKRLNPFLTTDNVIAAAWTRDDGHGDPSGLCNALAKAARDLGATVVRHNRVTDIRRAPSGEWEVVTEQGSIVAEMVVNAAGCYARQVAAMVGADAPITNMQHHYVVTHPIPAFMERSRGNSGDARFLYLRLFPAGTEIRADGSLREHRAA